MTIQNVIAEPFLLSGRSHRRMREIAMIFLGVAVLAVCAKSKVPVWPSPVPITLGTFAVLSIGASYGPRLGLATIFAYLAIGALGFDVFAGSSAEMNGWTYMLGGTGGYLVGYVLATLALGTFAQRGWDRTVWRMGAAMLVGNALIYAPGLLWLYKFASGWEQTLAWGFWPFLIGDMIKLCFAALIFPWIWKLLCSGPRYSSSEN